MASCIWQSISLTFLWATFFVRIFQHDCMTLQQSGLTVFPVDSCPRNLSEVESATLRLNCSDVKEFRNVYHCLPVSNLSLLVEFCYNRTSGLTGKGNCLVLSNEYINVRQCNHFTRGCPSVPYYYKKMFNFPECTQINKQNSCYEADPICPNISFVEGTTRPTVNAMENNTVLVGATTRLTVIAVENNSVLVEPTTISAFSAMQNPAVQIAIALGVCLPLISFALICLWTLWRHIRARKETPIEQEVTVMMATEDNAANELERSYLCDNIEDNRANRLAAFFKKKGTSIRFNNLRLDLIRGIPDRELNSLKASLQVMTELSTENVETIEGFFTFLFDEGIFQERNVIVMQSLMKSINRPDLERRCVEYAKEDNQAICFFEETTAPGDGNKHVLLHVVDDIEQFTEMEDLIATVAAIVGCHRSCIELVGVRPDSSFIIVISMKEEFARKLKQNDPFGLFGLSKYNVDWIKVENEVTDIGQDTPNESKERSLLMATEDNGANEHTLSGLKKTSSLMEKENISSDNSATEKMDDLSTSSGTETEMREEGEQTVSLSAEPELSAASSPSDKTYTQPALLVTSNVTPSHFSMEVTRAPTVVLDEKNTTNISTVIQEGESCIDIKNSEGKTLEMEQNIIENNLFPQTELLDSQKQEMESEYAYQFRHDRKSQGLALFVNFTAGRKGSENDAKYFTDTFRILGFDVHVEENLSKKEFQELIKKYSDDSTQKIYDSFVFAIGTHGMKVKMERASSGSYDLNPHILQMHDKTFFDTGAILKRFTRCRALNGKPKLFFIQACGNSGAHDTFDVGCDQGCHSTEPNEDKSSDEKTDDQEHIELTDEDSDEDDFDSYRVDDPDLMEDTFLLKASDVTADKTMTSQAEVKESGDNLDPHKNPRLPPPRYRDSSGDVLGLPRSIRCRPMEATAFPCYNDMLIMFTSPQGHSAFRNEKKGSYMFKFLYESVKKVYGEGRLLNNRTNFLSVLIDVAAKMSEGDFSKEGYMYKNVTCVVHKLSKDIIFSKGIQM